MLTHRKVIKLIDENYIYNENNKENLRLDKNENVVYSHNLFGQDIVIKNNLSEITENREVY